MIRTALQNLSIGHDIAPAFLEFVGIQDETKTVGKVLYMFNIEDPRNINYKSTICYVVKTR